MRRSRNLVRDPPSAEVFGYAIAFIIGRFVAAMVAGPALYEAVVAFSSGTKQQYDFTQVG